MRLRDRNGSRRGFTLIELAAVLGIIILLAAMIAPTVGPMRRQGRVRVGAAAVAESLRLARSLAIAQSSVYSVDLPAARQIRIYAGGGACVASDQIFQTSALPENVIRESVVPAFVNFQPDGSSSGFTVVIRADDRASERRTIGVSASGRVSVSGGGQ
jgi:prepilin-type N-terminal cleavage/methylation domain-containing protein